MDKAAKKVNAQQIDALYAFTRQHFVEYYDLQTELVDHLANAIETRWEHQPQLDFHEALQLEFKKFGVFGFMDVVEKRQLALSKKYYKLLWNYFKVFLRLPQIVLSILAIFLFYKLLEFSVVIYGGALTAILIIGWIRLWKIRKRYNQKVKETGKKWLLEDTIFNCGGFGAGMFIPLQIALQLEIDNVTPSPVYTGVLSVFFVVFALYNYVVLFIIPSKAEEHLKETYPEYNFEISS